MLCTNIFSKTSVECAGVTLLDESTNEEPDTNSVYYKFCGAAIAEMLHGRYSKRRNCVASKASINQEIQVLQCVNKEHIPQVLKYRVRGYMYFPAVEFLPFLRALDQSVMELNMKRGMSL